MPSLLLLHGAWQAVGPCTRYGDPANATLCDKRAVFLWYLKLSSPSLTKVDHSVTDSIQIFTRPVACRGTVMACMDVQGHAVWHKHSYDAALWTADRAIHN